LEAQHGHGVESPARSGTSALMQRATDSLFAAGGGEGAEAQETGSMQPRHSRAGMGSRVTVTDGKATAGRRPRQGRAGPATVGAEPQQDHGDSQTHRGAAAEAHGAAGQHGHGVESPARSSTSGHCHTGSAMEAASHSPGPQPAPRTAAEAQQCHSAAAAAAPVTHSSDAIEAVGTLQVTVTEACQSRDHTALAG
jgi:hypothetical protein